MSQAGHGDAGAVREGGALLWLAALVGIGAWMGHIIALASLIELTCERPGAEVAIHLVTLGTAAVTLAGMALCWRATRGHSDELAHSRGGRLRFVGLFGLLTGGVSLLLILWEGSYVLFLDACA